jgi:hypothetical protein
VILAGVPLDAAAAALAGLIAGVLMETPLYLQRALRAPVHQDVFAEGGLLLGVRGRSRRPVGFLGHAALSVVIALVYAGFFRAVGAGDHLLAWGALGGLVHFVVGGLVVGAIFPVVDRLPGLVASTPGFAYARYGRRDVLTFLGGHLSFGMLVGLLYAVLHPAVGLPAAV